MLMARYLKSVSMKADEGSILKIPHCCIQCSKKRCPLSCPEYEAAMKDVKCTRFDMEFAWKDVWWESFLRNLVYLVVIVFFVVVFQHVIGLVIDEYSFSVETDEYANLSAAECRITCKGRSIDANCFLQAVSNVLKKAGLK